MFYRNSKMLRIVAMGLVFVMGAVGFAGCRKTAAPRAEKIELVYYKLYDNEDVFAPLIQEYQSKNPNVTIKYRKFVDAEYYENLILNELAEGKGPDIFSVPNTWLDKNYKKIIPADPAVVAPQPFRDTFVSVAAKDLVRGGSPESERVYGIPLTVDTLALYYNKDHFEDRIPSRGKPSATWEGIKDDVFKLTKQDASFERFEVAGIAMGRSDNVIRAVDILYLMMLQNGVKFYNDDLTRANFGKDAKAAEALELYTSFALPANKNYSWNQYLSDANSAEKEIATFAKGKVSMMVGYSFAYQQILDNIAALKQKGVSTIDSKAVRVAPIPQIIDPEVSTDKRDAYAHYMVEVVGRNTENSQEAWKFLQFLASKENITHYSEKTKKPASRRDMIEEQRSDPIYGVFVDQIGYAESFLIFDEAAYHEAFVDAVEAVLATQKSRDALSVAEEKVNAILTQK